MNKHIVESRRWKLRVKGVCAPENEFIGLLSRTSVKLIDETNPDQPRTVLDCELREVEHIISVLKSPDLTELRKKLEDFANEEEE